MTLDEVASRYALAREELTAWVGWEWVRPTRDHGDVRFDECDAARVELICQLRQDLALDDEALPIVLSLLDQLYSTRRVLRDVGAALSTMPEPVRAQVMQRIGKALGVG